MSPREATILIVMVTLIGLLLLAALGFAAIEKGSQNDERPTVKSDRNEHSALAIFGLVLGLMTIIVTIIGIILTFFVPEVRRFLRLE